MMKLSTKRFLCLATCAALSASLALPASALLISPAPISSTTSDAPQSDVILVDGTMTWTGDRLSLTGGSDQSAYGEIILELPADVPVVDAATLELVGRDALKDGVAVHAYLSPAVTRSLPPIGTASLVLVNVSGQVPAYDAVMDQLSSGSQQQTQRPTAVRVWGSVEKLDEDSMLVSNSNDKDPYQRIILHVGPETKILNAVTGEPVAAQDIKEGETIYAYTSPMMLLSLPPQSTAQVILCQIPMDFGVPAYYEIADAALAQDGKSATFTALDGTQVTVNDSASITPYLTKNVVGLHDLVPGAQVLVWTGTDRAVSKVMVFPYSYRGYLQVSADGAASVSGQALALPARTVDGAQLVSLRAATDALGLTLSWDGATRTISIAAGDSVLLTTVLGTDTAAAGAETLYLSQPSVSLDGATYLEAGDLAHLLDLFHG